MSSFLITGPLTLTSCRHSATANYPLDTQYWCHSDAYDICKMEIILTRLTNDFRYRQGLAPLNHRKSLAYVAHEQSRRAAAQGKISHQDFPKTRSELLEGYAPEDRRPIVAENLLRLRSQEKDPERLAQRIFALWQESEPHRQQLLGPYRGHGASVVRLHDEIFAAAMFQL